MYLSSCFLQDVFILACDTFKTDTQLIIFRVFSDVAVSFYLYSAVSVINNTFLIDQRRNLAFASMSGDRSVGFDLALILSGVFVDIIEWR